MSKLVSFTRERVSENWKQTDYFIANNEVENVEEAMRKAVHEFLFTEEGHRMITYTCGDFNWGDALSSVPDELWQKHGIEIKYDSKEYHISGEIIEIIVNQDELLMSAEHELEEAE